MVLMQNFSNSQVYYRESAEEKLRSYTKGLEREDIVSVQRHEDGSITLFYWSN